MSRPSPLLLGLALLVSPSVVAAQPAAPDWTALEAETMRHFQVARNTRNTRPGAPPSRLDTEAFTAIETAVRTHYGAGVTTLPTMSTGATDMAFLRAKGMQCYGVGPLTDSEDGPKGFGAHSDQERILESSLHTFVKFHWDIVVAVAGAR